MARLAWKPLLNIKIRYAPTASRLLMIGDVRSPNRICDRSRSFAKKDLWEHRPNLSDADWDKVKGGDKPRSPTPVKPR